VASLLNIKDISELITQLSKNRWYKIEGLIISIVIALGFECAILLPFKVSFTHISIVYILTAIFIIIIWFYAKRIPKTHKGKVGFIVCIRYDADAQRAKIKEDFIASLQDLIKSGRAGSSFQFIKTPEHIANNIKDLDDANELRVKSKGHFVIYGRVRHRELFGKKHHVLNLNGLVSHKSIPQEVGQAFAEEFSELLPRKVNITEENDLLAFDFTTEWIECVSKYIIGIAAYFSLDFNYSEQLFNDVSDLLEHKDQAFPVYVKLKQRIPERLSEIHIARANGVATAWTKTHNPNLISLLGEHLQKVGKKCSSMYTFVLLKSIWLFLSEKDTITAKKELRKLKKHKDGTWRYNLAFLLAYEGSLKSSIKQYKHAFMAEMQPDMLSKIEEFIAWALEEEPNKYQLHYCLGYINRNKKGDIDLAIQDFENFLEHGDENEFVREKIMAERWIQEMKAQKQ